MKTLADVLTTIQNNAAAELKELIAGQPELAAQRDEKGNSPLLLATYYGRKELVGILLASGVQPNFFEACAAGLNDQAAAMLRSDPALVRQMSHDGWTPLHLAAFFGHPEIAAMLLDSGADLLAVSQNAQSNVPINAAAAGGHSEIVRMLIDRGCPADARSSPQAYTALHLAAHQGNAAMVRALLDAGADRSLTNGSGETAADLARKQGHSALLPDLTP